jgi:PRTRC genetic system protein E
VFVELMPLLKDRTLLITIARVDEKLKVNVIPAKIKEGEEHALTTPLSFTGSAEELDSELGRHLVSYVDSHLALGNTLAEAKAEMNAAAKAARQKVKTTQQASKADPVVRKKLGNASVTFVALNFDGYGDDGATEEVKCFASDYYAYQEHEPVDYDASQLQEHFEALVPFGYENDCGGFGDVVLDVAARKITVERNDRFEDYTTTTYEV